MPHENAQSHDEYDADLHPQSDAGARSGATRTAYDQKAAHRHLANYSDDDLKQIPILPSGSRLSQGATYLDLAEGRPRAFTATAEMRAGHDNLYVAKSEVDYQLWNRLIGVKNRERTGK
jgi:hypothetical protein